MKLTKLKRVPKKSTLIWKQEKKKRKIEKNNGRETIFLSIQNITFVIVIYIYIYLEIFCETRNRKNEKWN